MNYFHDVKEVFEVQVKELQDFYNRLDESVELVVNALVNCKGSIIVTGLGKSGIIGRKISSTLNSLGITSIFLHPVEALHGDLGVVQIDDVFFAISNSGETKEIVDLLCIVAERKNKIVCMTGNEASSIAQMSNYNLVVKVENEACFWNLAPTSSTTASLVLGDSIAVAVAKARGFTKESFSKNHPGGRIGYKTNTLVRDVMRSNHLPVISSNAVFSECLDVINEGMLGLCVVTDKSNVPIGVITDGDLRRIIIKRKHTQNLIASYIMTETPKCITEDSSINDAEVLMRKYKINSLLVITEEDVLSGVVQIYNL